MVKFSMARKLQGLYPVDETGENAIRKLGLGEIVSVDVTKPRNAQFHRKFFAMLNIIFKNQEAYKSVDDLLEVCKLRTGHCHTIQSKFGEVKITDSISWAKMDDIEFADFYNRACAWVIAEVIPGLERNHLDDEVRQELLGFGAPEG